MPKRSLLQAVQDSVAFMLAPNAGIVAGWRQRRTTVQYTLVHFVQFLSGLVRSATFYFSIALNLIWFKHCSYVKSWKKRKNTRWTKIGQHAAMCSVVVCSANCSRLLQINAKGEDAIAKLRLQVQVFCTRRDVSFLSTRHHLVWEKTKVS